MKTDHCQVARSRTRFELRSPSFAFHLDTSSGLRAVAWENRISGQTLRLGNAPELECDLDASERRIPITGWRGTASGERHGSPDAERGRRAGYQQPEFDDSKWASYPAPPLLVAGGRKRFYWTRTHVFVPDDCRGTPLRLVLGGVGLFDFQFLRVFLNGHLVGTRRAMERWHEPGEFDLGPSSSSHGLIRFGQDNVIALQLADPVTRTKQLDALDPGQARTLAWTIIWPAQFEQYLVVGRPLDQTKWEVVRRSVVRQGKSGEVVFRLIERRQRLEARVTYGWNATSPTLHKLVTITNSSHRPVRLMHVRLGSYRTTARVSEGEQGFPVYADGGFFASLVHPSGWAMGQDGSIQLRQYPGRMLQPGDTFHAMETVLGVSEKSAARPAFLAHVRGRTRRVRRGHDKPYAIFEAYGSWRIPRGNFLGEAESDAILLDNIRKVADGQRRSGCRFDLYSIDFWVDNDGDLQRPDPKYFPRGFDRVLGALKKTGMRPGLWIDSSMGGWTIGDNPVVASAFTHDSAYAPGIFRGRGYLCRATEPVRTIYRNAFRHHLRENGVRLVKFDNLQALCHNPSHGHLPGIYSTEAIHESVIEFLRALDAECRDAFLMLYWGYRSPWWLLHADTLFEPGLCIEAASPAPTPTLYARDGVTQGLDMAQWYCQDVPPLGKDSLGVWLSEWPWNSMVGKERWEPAFVMDMCRGSLLAQPWSDHAWLSPKERRQMAVFIDLLKARPECFANPQFVLGNPWKNEPYGYCCSDGRRAFLALHNCTWKDQLLPLSVAALGERGIDGGTAVVSDRGYSVYRWYPDPARLPGDATKIALRPFEVVLLEIVPPGQEPSLGRVFPQQTVPGSFAEPSRALRLATASRPVRYATRLPCEADPREPNSPPLPPKRVWEIRGRVPGPTRGGILVVTAERSRRGVASQSHAPGKELAVVARLDRRAMKAVPVLGTQTYPSPWQAWRIGVGPSSRPQRLRAFVTVSAAKDVKVVCHAYYIPKNER